MPTEPAWAAKEAEGVQNHTPQPRLGEMVLNAPLRKRPGRLWARKMLSLIFGAAVRAAALERNIRGSEVAAVQRGIVVIVCSGV